MKLDEFGGVVFRRSQNCKLCKVHRMTPSQTEVISLQKYPYLCALYPEFQSVVPFALQTAVFRDIHIILGFPIDTHVKISKCHKIFKFWQIVKMCHNFFYSWLPYLS